ncbi:uncharacterized protein PAC_02518 [Phialocephala subalpina]|uniref:2EXR domain-containing protein n=1 Tax=Phialocephala subalpina TaxID=576137 RepID=A0A1L7WIQ0_9HELO|nr:uncharacterized protein PAC_02518 [Phialocephala subalpina]
MNNQHAVIPPSINPQNPVAQPASISRKAASYELLEILHRIHPPVYRPDDEDNMSKKDRQNKKKKLHVRRKERAALKPADHSSNQKPGRAFKINPDGPYETGNPSSLRITAHHFFATDILTGRFQPLGKTPTEFTLFNKLAPEIHEMIWNYALNDQAQAIKIIGDGYNHELRPTLLSTTHRFTYRAKASYVPSVLLEVNSESRDIVNKQYPLAFGPQLGGRPIRFNFSRDILYFESPNAMINFYGGTLPMFNVELDVYGFSEDMNEVHDNVQHVAVGHIRYFKGTVGATLNQYKNLKTVILGAEVGDDQYAANEIVVDYLTGDRRLQWGWERYQNFKTVPDGNYPSVLRYRADAFKKKVDEEYMQIKKYSSKPKNAIKFPEPIPKGLVDCMAGIRINCADD